MQKQIHVYTNNICDYVGICSRVYFVRLCKQNILSYRYHLSILYFVRKVHPPLTSWLLTLMVYRSLAKIKSVVVM